MKKDVNVLILDDEENILNSLRRLFVMEPYGVFVTSDANEALDVIDKESIKVVISDQRMPHITGVEFLAQVKERKMDIMRILFTGYTDLQAAEDAINIGEVYRFINKPWNGPDLKSAVQEAISHYDLHMENNQLLRAAQDKNMELKELNNKLSAMFEKQREFTSVVSHELRTPLASIKAALDIVMSESSGELSEDQNNFLNMATANVNRLRSLIDSILELSKLESGKAKLKVDLNNIKDYVKENVEINLEAANEQGLSLKAEVDDGIPQICFDANRINQVLNNLINNAIKFTKSGGITVIVKNLDNHIQVCVKDSGVGIEEADLIHVFDKFSQVESIEKCEKGGTGLGLAISREIVNQHQGKMWVTSQVNEGSEFYFTIPHTIKNYGDDNNE